ncbi:hypothetical protein Q8G81_33610, partial [Klebsiella pneumoniae]
PLSDQLLASASARSRMANTPSPTGAAIDPIRQNLVAGGTRCAPNLERERVINIAIIVIVILNVVARLNLNRSTLD